MKRYEAHLVPTSPTTAHAAPLRWDGERFREGYSFDAEAFDAPEQAEQVLNREAADAKGFIPTVAEITDAE